MNIGANNIGIINDLQARIKKNETYLTKKDLEKLEIDLTKSPQSFLNIILKKDFFGDWFIKVDDETADLDGKQISKNKKLISRLKALWENGINEIKFSELLELNICTPATSLSVLNFKLSNKSHFYNTGCYSIAISDTNKNIDGLWLDKMVNTDMILEVLRDFNISSKNLACVSELELNKLLEIHFKKYFESIKKGGTSDKGLIDLIIGDMVYGIELKLSRELKKTSQMQRALGQIDIYMEKFATNFMVIIAGNEEEKKEKCVQDLIKKIRLGKGTYYYLEAHD